MACAASVLILLLSTTPPFATECGLVQACLSSLSHGIDLGVSYLIMQHVLHSCTSALRKTGRDSQAEHAGTDDGAAAQQAGRSSGDAAMEVDSGEVALQFESFSN